MTFNAEALRLLAEKGLSLADVAEIAAAMEKRKDPTAAERQSRRRAKLKEVEGAPITRNKSRRDVTRDPLPNEYISNPTPEPLKLPDGSSSPTVLEIEVEDETLRPDEVLEAWNDVAGRRGLPKAKLTPERRRKLLPRLRQHSLEDWTEAIAAIDRTPFFRGENDRGWRPTFDFLLQPASFTKLIEGGYDSTH